MKITPIRGKWAPASDNGGGRRAKVELNMLASLPFSPWERWSRELRHADLTLVFLLLSSISARVDVDVRSSLLFLSSVPFNSSNRPSSHLLPPSLSPSQSWMYLIADDATHEGAVVDPYNAKLIASQAHSLGVGVRRGGTKRASSWLDLTDPLRLSLSLFRSPCSSLLTIIRFVPWYLCMLSRLTAFDFHLPSSPRTSQAATSNSFVNSRGSFFFRLFSRVHPALPLSSLFLIYSSDTQRYPALEDPLASQVSPIKS